MIPYFSTNYILLRSICSVSDIVIYMKPTKINKTPLLLLKLQPNGGDGYIYKCRSYSIDMRIKF